MPCSKNIAAVIAEMMKQYDKYRSAWIAKFGNDHGFDEWFTKQVFGRK